MKKHIAIGAAFAAALAFAAAPAFATADAPTTAAGDTVNGYADDAPVNVSPAVIAQCDTSSVIFGPGYFQPGETVGVSVSGANAGAANLPSSITAASDGSTLVVFSPPAGATGPYALSFASPSASYQTVITVDASADTCESPTAELPLTPASSNPPTELPLTASSGTAALPMELPLTGGGGLDPLLLGIGGGAIVLGASLAIIGATRGRRNKA